MKVKSPDTDSGSYISSKLVKNPDDDPQVIDLDKIDFGIMGRYSKKRASISAEILETFPELEFTMNMIISSMTAPTDVITDTIVMSMDSESPLLDAETKNQLLAVFKDEINNYYKMEDNIFDYIKKTMVTDGAYCELILPEAMVEKVMFTTSNVNLESEYLKLVEKPRKNNFEVEDPSIEELKKEFEYLDEYIDSTDNPVVLKVGDMKLNANLEGSTVLEKVSTTKKKKLLDAVFKDGIDDVDKVKNLFTLDNDLRESHGRPFRLQIPIEAVTPISYKHDTKKHLGYVITLDENYMPISDRSYRTVSGVKKDTDDTDISNALVLTQSIINKARNNAYKNVEKEPMIEELDMVASKIIDEKLKTMVVGNNLKELVDSDMLNNVYLIMLNRALKKQKTKILFVPKEYMWYMALQYRDNGTGKTVLEDLGNISSLRSLLRHSRVFANLRSTIPLEKYDIVIDDDVKNIDKYLAKARSFINRNRSMTMPNGLITSTDVTDWLHNSGIVMNVTHKDIPTFDIDKSVMDVDIKIPDDDIDEELRKATYMKIGINPEIVESALSNADFAGTINTQNLMYARDIIRKQKPVNVSLKNFTEIVVSHDMVFRKRLMTIIDDRMSHLMSRLSKDMKETLKESAIEKEELRDYFLEEVLKIFKIHLPVVENFDDNGLDKQFEYKYDNIDKVIELFLSSDAISEELSGIIGEKADDIKEAMKASVLREWMIENNYMPELLNMFTKTEKGVVSTPLEDYRVFVDNVKEAFIKFKKKTVKDKAKTDAKIEELDEYELPEENDEEPNADETPTDEAPEDDQTDEDQNDDTEGDDEPTEDNTDDTEEPTGDEGDETPPEDDGLDVPEV